MVENSAAVMRKRLVSMNMTKTLDSQVHHICIDMHQVRQKYGERSKLLALFYPSDTIGLLGLAFPARVNENNLLF